ncbi:MAG: glycosyltransferase family 2 protein [Lachnospiraceae bacterium]
MIPKISIITPAYNSERYIDETIQSVRAQTYQNWEMIIVDDCSSDATCQIVNKYIEIDGRIKLHQLDINCGAAVARNSALHITQGRFIAYLDADDIWCSDKLELQMNFMLNNKYGFSCTSYEVISDDGQPRNKEIHMLSSVDYMGFLTNNLLQTVGIMVDIDIVDRELLIMPLMRRRQDAATWLQILKAGHKCYGLDSILAKYRRIDHSLSSNKIKAAKAVWHLYRDNEKISLPLSCYCFSRYALLAVWKRIYIRKKVR